MSDAFLHNWADQVFVTTSYQTVVTSAQDSLAEERVGLVERPTRSIRFRWCGVSRGEGQRMLLALALAGSAGLSLPLYCDQAITTASSSGTTINCPTADRRFEVGKQVVIFAIGDDGRPTNVQTPTVSVIGGSSITTSGALTGTYATGAFVFPLVVTQPVLQPSAVYESDEVMTVDLEVMEVPESSLAGQAAVGDDPTGFTLEDQWPIFHVEPDWTNGVEIGLQIAATTYAQGRSVVVETQGPRPRVTVAMELVLFDRAAVFDVIRFFDSRGGRCAPFWLVSPNALWTPTNLTTGFVDVEEHGVATDAEDFWTHVGVVMEDGTVYVRAISSIADSGSTWRVTFAVSLPSLNLADVVRITPAFFGRLADDSLREAWLTDEVCTLPFKFVEVFDEGAVALP